MEPSLAVIAWLHDVIAAIRRESPHLCAWLIRSREEAEEPCMVVVPRADPTLESTIVDTVYLAAAGDGAHPGGLQAVPAQVGACITARLVLYVILNQGCIVGAAPAVCGIMDRAKHADQV
jgi:hypothetical protein